VIASAILYLATPDDAGASARPLLGFPIVVRAIAAAVRAGAAEVFLPSALATPALERALVVRPSLATAVRWLSAERPAPTGPALLVPAAALAAPSGIARLLAEPVPALLMQSEAAGAPIITAPAATIVDLGPALVSGLPVGNALARVIKTLDPRRLAEDAWYARTPTARTLLSHLGSVVDTRLDRALHRRLSCPVSRLAVACGISANTMSVASLGVGLVAVACFWRATAPSALTGLAFYVASVVLDHVDGEVARLTLAESTLGAWLDVLNDTVVHALLVVAIGVTVGRSWPPATALGAVSALGVIASALVAKLAPPAAEALGGLLANLASRDGFYALLVLFTILLAALPIALPFFMVVIALGPHAYWLARTLYALVPR
jgi:phosphatidylglycerophosphate synthase